jgi:hypothetical protein
MVIRAERNTPTSSYDAQTYSGSTVDVPVFSETSGIANLNPPSTTTSIGFLTRDPIGYHDGWNLYQNYFLVSKKDPSGMTCGEYWTGCSTEPIDEKDVVGMRWNDVDLAEDGGDPKLVTLGQTILHSMISCPCIKCCDKWYLDHVSIHSRLIILLDKDAHTRTSKSLRGSYGHEQLHVLNFMREMKKDVCPAIFAGVDKGPFANEAACNAECNILKKLHLKAMGAIPNCRSL